MKHEMREYYFFLPSLIWQWKIFHGDSTFETHEKSWQFKRIIKRHVKTDKLNVRSTSTDISVGTVCFHFLFALPFNFMKFILSGVWCANSRKKIMTMWQYHKIIICNVLAKAKNDESIQYKSFNKEKGDEKKKKIGTKRRKNDKRKKQAAPK